MTAEGERLSEARTGGWRQWGPYLSERQWGTVREDYSDNGDAWNYFTHDQARSRAYRWGEDGLAGVCDDQGLMCLALSLWNGADPILKERLFGLTNTEGNHGEDVKEYYFYVDNVPTHSWMRWRYKYPQSRVPVRRPAADQPRAWVRRPGVRAARHRHLRRRPLFRRAGRLRQGRSDRSARADHRAQPQQRGRAAPPAAHPVVPQHLVAGRAVGQAHADGGRRGLCRASPRSTPSSATTGSMSVRTPTSCSATTRPTPNACGDNRIRRPTSRTGSTVRWSRARPMPSTPRVGPRSRRTGKARCPRVSRSWSSCG